MFPLTVTTQDLKSLQACGPGIIVFEGIAQAQTLTIYSPDHFRSLAWQAIRSHARGSEFLAWFIYRFDLDWIDLRPIIQKAMNYGLDVRRILEHLGGLPSLNPGHDSP